MRNLQVTNDETWTRILSLHTNPSGRSDAPPTFATLLGRNKRQAQCNCGPTSRGCPDGTSIVFLFPLSENVLCLPYENPNSFHCFTTIIEWKSGKPYRTDVFLPSLY